MQTYKYDAFISYRHTEPDKTIAERLHRILETYRVPKAVVKMGIRKKVGRVFRDREELPTSSNLAESIQEALENSEHLIVVCSPRTPGSQWVCKEIETFAALHGHDRILALLIEGEPEESFPEQLRFVKKKLVLEGGTVTEVVQEVEPLAADIRAEGLRGMKKKLKTEVLRLLAPILNCRFDDLRQRHRERRIKRALAFSLALSAFLLLFGSYSAFQAALIRQQAEVIRQKSEEVEQHAEMLEMQVEKTLRSQSLYLADLALKYLESGDRLGAVLVAREALPKNLDNPERPYVEEAEYALCEALGVYETIYDYSVWGDAILKHSDIVNHTALSPDGKKLATITNNKVIYIWNTENGALLNTLAPDLDLNDYLHFLDGNTLLFRSYDKLHCINVETLEENWSFDYPAPALAISGDNSKIALIGTDLIILDAATGNPLKEAPKESLLPDTEYVSVTGIAFDESGNHVFFSTYDGKIVKVDLEQMKAEAVYQATYNYIIDMAAGAGERIAVVSFDYEAAESYCLDVFDESGNTYSIATSSRMEKISFNPYNIDQILYVSFENLGILNIHDSSRYICTHDRNVTDYHIFEDTIITSSSNGIIRFWNMDGTQKMPWFNMDTKKAVKMLDFSPGLYALTYEDETLLLRAHNNRHALIYKGHSNYIEEMVYLKDSNRMAALSDDGELMLWDLAKQDVVSAIHTDSTSTLSSIHAVDHGGKILFFSGMDKEISLYDSATLELIRSESYDYLSAITLSADHSLACLIGPSEIRIIDTGSLETITVLPIKRTSEAVFFNDNSKVFLKNEQGLYILDIPSQTVIKEKPTDSMELTCFRLSHDSSVLACICGNRIVKLLDAYTLEEKLTIDCSGAIPKAVFFDPWDETLFIAFHDHSVGRFSTADGTLVSMLDKKVEGLVDILFDEGKNIFITIGKAESYLGKTESFIWHNDTNKAVGRIPDLCTADLESGRLFIITYDKFQILPIFDLPMLFEEAEWQLQGRTLTPEEKKRLFIVE